MLQVEDLSIELADGCTLVDGVSFEVADSAALGLVGESGSGKSLTLRAILGLLPDQVRVRRGRILLDGTDLLGLDRAGLRAMRGRQVSMIFQDPMTGLNPVMKVGDQIAEGLIANLGRSRRQAHRRAVELMDSVGIEDAERRAQAYPFQFSGGMRQRVMIAIALSCGPQLILCDEPTSALDVTTQAQILRILAALRESEGVGLVFVTHDLPVVAQLCDQVAVMYAGQLIETGATRQVFGEPRHPYTRALLRSAPDLHAVRHRLEAIPGLPPDPRTPPAGCRFHDRCGYGERDCTEDRRFALVPLGAGRSTACIHPLSPEVTDA